MFIVLISSKVEVIMFDGPIDFIKLILYFRIDLLNLLWLDNFHDLSTLFIFFDGTVFTDSLISELACFFVNYIVIDIFRISVGIIINDRTVDRLDISN